MRLLSPDLEGGYPESLLKVRQKYERLEIFSISPEGPVSSSLNFQKWGIPEGIRKSSPGEKGRAAFPVQNFPLPRRTREISSVSWVCSGICRSGEIFTWSNIQPGAISICQCLFVAEGKYKTIFCPE